MQSSGNNRNKRDADSFDRQDNYTGEEYYEERTGKSAKTEEIVAKRKNAGKVKKARKTALVVILILAIILAAGVIALEIFTEPPDTSDDKGIKNDDEGVAPGVDGGRKDGVYTLLVVGRDKVGNNTDTIMVGRFDVVNQTLNVVSIPRDTLVNINYNKKNINYVYPASVNSGEDAIGELCEAISDMLGFYVDNYIVIDIQAAAELVGCIGGVDFNVPVDMVYDDPVQDLHINIKAGKQTLDGEDAVKVFRYREGYADADLGRINVQHDLLMAIAKQTLSLGNLLKIDEIIDIAEKHTETDLTGDNIRFYIKEFLKINSEDIKFLTLPYTSCGMIFNWSSLFADIDAWLDMVNEYLNPYEQDVTLDNINMITYKDGNFYYTSEPMRGSIQGMLGYKPGTSVDGAGMIKYVSSK